MVFPLVFSLLFRGLLFDTHLLHVATERQCSKGRLSSPKGRRKCQWHWCGNLVRAAYSSNSHPGWCSESGERQCLCTSLLGGLAHVLLVGCRSVEVINQIVSYRNSSR